MLSLGNCYVKKFSTLSVSLENKQSTIAPNTTLQLGFNSKKYWLLLLAKAQKDLLFHDLQSGY